MVEIYGSYLISGRESKMLSYGRMGINELGTPGALVR